MISWTAIAFQALTLTIQNQPTAFLESSREHLLISADSSKKTTRAREAWESSLKSPAPAKINAAQPLGAAHCLTRFQGRIVIAKRKNQNETGLCRFADGSFLALSSLSYANQDLGR